VGTRRRPEALLVAEGEGDIVGSVIVRTASTRWSTTVL
jgi:hypothetical protein